jgi:gliding motility-associated-like protein
MYIPVFAQTLKPTSESIEFIQNKNQWESTILYKAELGSGTVFLEKNCFTFAFKDMKAIDKILSFKHIPTEECPKLTPADYNIKCHAYKLNFLNAKQDVKISASQPFEGYYNYFIGNDKNKWASKVNSYAAIAYNGLYKNTDLNIYESDSHLKYDITLHPGSDVTDIRFQYVGADKVVLRGGDLIVKTSVNEVTELSPEAYQMNGSVKVKVACKFKLTDNILTFIFPDGYDKSKDVVIDPTLIFSTYSGSHVDNWGFTATFDDRGRVYSGGIAFGTGYPVSVGAFQTNFAGGELGAYLIGCDVAIIKYDSSGTQRLFATYLGGSRNDLPHSMIVNSSNELVVYGTTGSSDFPVTSGAFDQTFNGGDSMAYDFNSLKFSHGIDIFVAKIKADGTQLLAATYVGGSKNDGMNDPSPLSINYADGARGEVLTDAQNNIYVTSTTNSTDFPVTAGAFQTTPGGGGQDGVVFKLNTNLTNMIWSSYIGGSGNDAVYAMVLDANNNVYVTGGTNSINFPITPGTLHTSYMGGYSDGFISMISQNGSTLLKSTYYGSSAYDQSYLIEKDKTGDIYVFGQTSDTSNTFIFNAAWNKPKGGQFISKITPDLSTLVWSTAFGTGNTCPNNAWANATFGTGKGAPDISPTAFLVDVCNNIYLSGWGGPYLNQSRFGGTTGLQISPGAFQPTTDDNDYYFLVITNNASTMKYATYFGSPHAYEHVDGGTSRFDRNGRIYQGVCGGCGGWSDFPTTPGAWSNTNNSSNCNNAVIKFDFGLPLVIADFILPDACASLNDYFQNTSQVTGVTGISYSWSFGDGGTSTLTNPYHNYPSQGFYNVTLIVRDSGSCNVSDTITKQIAVNMLPLVVSHDTAMCSGSALLNANSSGTASSYIWSTSINLADTLNHPITNNSVTVSPTVTTTYYVQVSNQYCTKLDSVHVKISNVRINAGLDHKICKGDTTTINVTNLNPSDPLTYQWSPSSSIISGVNSSTANVNPSSTTSYIVLATDTMGCQKTDTITITVSSMLSNLSTDSVKCFGDCNGGAVVNPIGGISPYTYHWNNGGTLPNADSLCAGIYTVTISDNIGCKMVLPVSIFAPQVLTAFISDTNMVFCNGICNGYATVSVSGGTSSYNYQWIDGQTTPTADSLCAGNYSVTITDHNGCRVSIPISIVDTSNFNAAIDSIIAPSCFGNCNAIAFAIANGGLQPYSYNWDNADTLNFADSLCAGTHNVHITEHAGCIRNIFFTISSPAPVLFASSTSSNPSCTGFCDGQIIVNASGGTPSYTYQWNNGQSGNTASSLCQGTYYVTAYDSHHCTKSDTITITDPTPLLLNTTATNAPCVEVCNGVATATASGSSPPYTYQWSNGYNGNPATNLCPGTYFITVTDSHLCSRIDTVVVKDSATFPPVIHTYADDTLLYSSQSTGLHTTVINGNEYTWSPTIGLNNPSSPNPVATPVSTTTYYVTIEDQYGCTYVDSVKIIVIDVLCDASQIFVPNAFTPNGDQNNDILYVRSNILKSIYFVIYDRWGEKVFESYSLSDGWDGTFRGKACDPGVFDYYMKAVCLDNKEFIKKGNITLIR